MANATGSVNCPFCGKAVEVEVELLSVSRGVLGTSQRPVLTAQWRTTHVEHDCTIP